MAYTSKEKKEIISTICKHLEEGLTIEDSCEVVGIARQTLYNWMKKLDVLDTIKKSEAKNKRRNILIVQNAALKNWTAAAWWLERRFSKEYALRQKLEHSGEGGGPIEINASFRAALKKAYGKEQKEKQKE